MQYVWIGRVSTLLPPSLKMMSVRFLKAMLSCVCLALIGSSAAVCVHGDARVAVRQGQAEFVSVAKFQERERDRSLWEEMLAMERRLQRFREEGDVEEFGRCAEEWLEFWERCRVEGVMAEFERKLEWSEASGGKEGWERDVYAAMRGRVGEVERCWLVYRDAELAMFRFFLGPDSPESRARTVARKGMLTMQFAKCWYQLARHSAWCAGELPVLPDYWEEEVDPLMRRMKVVKDGGRLSEQRVASALVPEFWRVKMDFYVRMVEEAQQFRVFDVVEGRQFSKEEAVRLNQLFAVSQRAWEDYLLAVQVAVEPIGYFSGSATGMAVDAVTSWMIQQRARTILLYLGVVEEEEAGDADFLSGGWGEVVPVE